MDHLLFLASLFISQVANYFGCYREDKRVRMIVAILGLLTLVKSAQGLYVIAAIRASEPHISQCDHLDSTDGPLRRFGRGDSAELEWVVGAQSSPNGTAFSSGLSLSDLTESESGCGYWSLCPVFLLLPPLAHLQELARCVTQRGHIPVRRLFNYCRGKIPR